MTGARFGSGGLLGQQQPALRYRLLQAFVFRWVKDIQSTCNHGNGRRFERTLVGSGVNASG